MKSIATVAEIFARLGCHPTPISRDPAHVFNLGTSYADCPRCGRFAGIYIDSDGTWRAACSCFGKPWARHTRLDALVALVAAEAKP